LIAAGCRSWNSNYGGNVDSLTPLAELARTKRRGMQGISFRSMDAMITIRLDDVSVNSTVIANQLSPKWDEVSIILLICTSWMPILLFI
jgi:hypothetical protein